MPAFGIAHFLEIFFHEIVDLFLGFFLGDAVFFLDLAREFLEIAFSLVDLVVRQLAPLFLGGAFDLFPFSFQYVFLHVVPFL